MVFNGSYLVLMFAQVAYLAHGHMTMTRDSYSVIGSKPEREGGKMSLLEYEKKDYRGSILFFFFLFSSHVSCRCISRPPVHALITINHRPHLVGCEPFVPVLEPGRLLKQTPVETELRVL